MRITPFLLLLTACAAPSSVVPQDPGLLVSSEPEVTPAPEREVDPPARPEPYQAAPWTEAFLSPAVLMADSIQVLGPPGLFEHAAVRGEDSLFHRKLETIPEGRRLTVRPRPDSPEPEFVRAQLDAWQLAGFREVVFQEGLDPALPVRVVATGDAVWRDTNGKEQRDIRLSFKGEAPSGR